MLSPSHDRIHFRENPAIYLVISQKGGGKGGTKNKAKICPKEKYARAKDQSRQLIHVPLAWQPASSKVCACFNHQEQQGTGPSLHALIVAKFLVPSSNLLPASACLSSQSLLLLQLREETFQ